MEIIVDFEKKNVVFFVCLCAVTQKKTTFYYDNFFSLKIENNLEGKHSVFSILSVPNDNFTNLEISYITSKTKCWHMITQRKV